MVPVHNRLLRCLYPVCLVTILAVLGPGSRSAVRARGSVAMRHVTLILDFLPNAGHIGIFHALHAGYYARAGIDLSVIQPTSTSDTLKLIATGKADFGIADGIDVAAQIDLGRDAQAIMAVVQRPLVGLITLAKAGISSAKGLEGKTIGITGVPSDTVTAKTILTHAGADYRKVTVVTIGFNGVQDLENGKIAAFTGFWPADGVQAQVSGFPVRSFKLDENGGPRYPGLVLFTTRAHIAADPGLMRDFVAATVRGYDDALRSPAHSLADLLAENPLLKRGLTQAQLDQYLPLFRAHAPRYGLIDSAASRDLSTFLRKNGLIRSTIDPARYATNQFVPAR